jgi:RHS repeat-associated protein
MQETVAGYAKLNSIHGYDAAGRRLTTTQDGQTTQFEWDKASRLTKVILPNTVETEYSFNGAAQLARIQYRRNGVNFEDYRYERDAVGAATKIETLNGTYDFVYDAAHQLVGESRAGFMPYTANYEYDGNGNRVSRTIDGTTRIFTYNDADQLVSWAEGQKVGTFGFDEEGNQVAADMTDNGTLVDRWNYGFDAVGRMKTAQQISGGTQSLQNTYFADTWKRIQSVSNGVVRKFGWKQSELFAEFDGGGNLTAGYFGGMDSPLYKTNFSNNGQTVESRHFYHQDANLRVHHLTDANGAILEKYVYDGYGKRTILTPQDGSLNNSAVGNRIGFQGREHEELTGPVHEDGLTYHRNRFYSSGSGSFTSPDPIGYSGGTNLYGFAGGDPVNAVDPMGLDTIKIKDGIAYWVMEKDGKEAGRQQIGTARRFGGVNLYPGVGGGATLSTGQVIELSSAIAGYGNGIGSIADLGGTTARLDYIDKELGRFNQGSLKAVDVVSAYSPSNLAGAAWEAAKSGELNDSLEGVSQGILETVLPFEIEQGAPTYGHWDTYRDSRIIGQASGTTMNLVMIAYSPSSLANLNTALTQGLSQGGKALQFAFVGSTSVQGLSTAVVATTDVAYSAAGLLGMYNYSRRAPDPNSGLPNQEHHYSTNKSTKYTPRMKKIADKYGLDLDETWNKDILPHLGRHPELYHEFVLENMTRAASEAGNDFPRFLELFEKYVKKPIKGNPDLLRKKGWTCK